MRTSTPPVLGVVSEETVAAMKSLGRLTSRGATAGGFTRTEYVKFVTLVEHVLQELDPPHGLSEENIYPTPESETDEEA